MRADTDWETLSKSPVAYWDGAASQCSGEQLTEILLVIYDRLLLAGLLNRHVEPSGGQTNIIRKPLSTTILCLCEGSHITMSSLTTSHEHTHHYLLGKT